MATALLLTKIYFWPSANKKAVAGNMSMVKGITTYILPILSMDVKTEPIKCLHRKTDAKIESELIKA